MQPYCVPGAFVQCFLERWDEGVQDLAGLTVTNQGFQQCFVGRLLGVIDQLRDGLCTSSRLLGVRQIQYRQTHLFVQQTLQLGTTIRIELLAIKRRQLLGLDLAWILGFGFPALEVLFPFTGLQQQGQ